MMRLAFFYVVVIFYHGFGNVWQSIRTIVNTYDSVITKGGNVLTVKQIVESTDTLAGRVFDLFIQKSQFHQKFKNNHTKTQISVKMPLICLIRC